jgi:nicotinamidase-related amidase
VSTPGTRPAAAGGTVAWVVPGHEPPSAKDREFFGDEVAALYAESGGSGPVRSRLADGLDVASSDLAVEKTARSAWAPGASELPSLLAARDVDTIIVTGTVTNVCVEDTVRGASAAGLRVILVADACAAMRDQDHNATLHVVYRSFGDVRPTAEVLDLISASAVG